MFVFKGNFKFVFLCCGIILGIILFVNYTYAFDNDSLLSSLDISVDEEKNLTTTFMPQIADFLKNPYKGYSSEDAYSQVNGVVDWRNGVDEYTTEGYLRLNWYLFYKNSFVGPKDATNYNDSAYDWTVLWDLIKLYADHGKQLRFGVMTANSTSNNGAINAYKANPDSMIQYHINTLTDLQMPVGSIVPIADYIPIITMNDGNKIKLTCGTVDCSQYDSNGNDNYSHTLKTINEGEFFYKSRNITPMWMFEGIPYGYDELGNPIYSENAVKWYLSRNNLEWLPKWDDSNLINNINDFVNAMSSFLKNEEYKGKKLIDYISFVEVRSYGDFGENHIDQTIISNVNADIRNPFLCGYLDTSAHNYLYAYSKDSNFEYPSACYFDSNGENAKIYVESDYYFGGAHTKKYYINIGFDYFRDKYLKTYIDAFNDTDVRLVFNWHSAWDMDYYDDKGFIHNDTLKSFIEEYKGKVTIRGDSIFGISFGEGTQFAQINGIAPTAFEYVLASYKKNYDKVDYFSNLKNKIVANNLCNNKFDCLTTYFVNVAEYGRLSYMDYNYVLYDYYQNYLNNVNDDYLLDLDYLGNSLGYHFVMKKAEFTSKVKMNGNNNLKINLDVVNDGVTYLYDKDDTKLYVALLDTDGNGNVLKDKNGNSVVANKFITDVEPTTWKSSLDITGNRDSSDSSNWINESIELNVSDAEEGKYILAIGLFTEFDDNYPTIKFGNKGGTNDNWYALGEIELVCSKYNISYNGNGGFGIMESNIVSHGDAFKLSKNIFSREGYRFKGWNTKSDGTGDSYTDEQEVSIIENITLYAIWEESYSYVINEYTVDDDNKYIDLIDIGTTVDEFKDNFDLNDGYTVDVEYKSVNGKNLIYTGGKTRVYKDGGLYAEYTNIIRGDVNGNAIIDIIDYIRIMKHIMEEIVLEDEAYKAADVNQNNMIDIIDYIRIMKMIMEEN